jgi:hypothetical protein
MSTAERYYIALLVLSGIPALVEARKSLTNISNQDLREVIAHGLTDSTSRTTLDSIATQLFDGATADAFGAESVNVPVVNNAPAQAEVGVREALGSARQGDFILDNEYGKYTERLVGARRQPTAEAPGVDAVPSSSKNGKRNQQDAFEAPRKRKRLSRTAAHEAEKQAKST